MKTTHAPRSSSQSIAMLDQFQRAVSLLRVRGSKRERRCASPLVEDATRVDVRLRRQLRAQKPRCAGRDVACCERRALRAMPFVPARRGRRRPRTRPPCAAASRCSKTSSTRSPMQTRANPPVLSLTTARARARAPRRRAPRERVLPVPYVGRVAPEDLCNSQVGIWDAEL